VTADYFAPHLSNHSLQFVQQFSCTIIGEVRYWVGEVVAAEHRDIEIKIDFKEDDGSAARVFEIASSLIHAFEDLDRVLTTSVDSSIRTTLILEDIEKSSLKILLRNVLKSLDDQALKDLDWKKQVGTYLLQAKHAALKWLDQDMPEGATAPIEDLTDHIRELAQATDVRHLPDYPPLNNARIAQPLDAIQRAKRRFKPGEGLTITLDDREYSVDLTSHWLPSDHLPKTTAESELSNDVHMVLVIRRPDLLQDTQWQFRHGKTTVAAPIADHDWMDQFRAGAFPLKPGDALRVLMRFEYKYDANGDLIEQKTSIVRVFEVIPAPGTPKELF
jgi:hypothetical protein